MKPSVCVEIGSARGKSACYVATALRENGQGHLYAIDPHAPTNWNDSESVETYDLMRKNLAQLGLDGFVTLVRQDSVSAAKEWTKPIDLLFIDGDHSYEGAKADWINFSKFINPFGLVVFHDTLWDLRPDPRFQRTDMGVPRLVEELRREGYPVLTIDKDYGVSIVQPVRNGCALSM
jgi:predicted O-methyltransferase YrrM